MAHKINVNGQGEVDRLVQDLRAVRQSAGVGVQDPPLFTETDSILAAAAAESFEKFSRSIFSLSELIAESDFYRESDYYRENDYL